MDEWFLYLIRTRHGTLYTGITTDVDRRLAEHEGAGAKGSKYLRSRAPLQLVYRATIGSRALAQQVESQVKSLPKRKKEEIVAAGPEAPELLGMLALSADVIPPR
jgi:putative endonuclease